MAQGSRLLISMACIERGCHEPRSSIDTGEAAHNRKVGFGGENNRLISGEKNKIVYDMDFR